MKWNICKHGVIDRRVLLFVRRVEMSNGRKLCWRTTGTAKETEKRGTKRMEKRGNKTTEKRGSKKTEEKETKTTEERGNKTTEKRGKKTTEKG